MFLHLSVSHSVHGGGCLPQCMLGYTVSSASACLYRHGCCCGRYASYWNAFLFTLFLMPAFFDFLDYNRCTERLGFCRNVATCERTWTSARCHCADRYQGDRCDNCTERFQGDGCTECADDYYGNSCGN